MVVVILQNTAHELLDVGRDEKVPSVTSELGAETPNTVRVSRSLICGNWVSSVTRYFRLSSPV
jgi:hypothetical protein